MMQGDSSWVKVVGLLLTSTHPLQVHSSLLPLSLRAHLLGLHQGIHLPSGISLDVASGAPSQKTQERESKIGVLLP